MEEERCVHIKIMYGRGEMLTHPDYVWKRRDAYTSRLCMEEERCLHINIMFHILLFYGFPEPISFTARKACICWDIL
jgi:hypothetical protein